MRLAGSPVSGPTKRRVRRSGGQRPARARTANRGEGKTPTTARCSTAKHEHPIHETGRRWTDAGRRPCSAGC